MIQFMSNKKLFADTDDDNRKKKGGDDKRNKQVKRKYDGGSSKGGQNKNLYDVFHGVPDQNLHPLHPGTDHTSGACRQNPYKKKKGRFGSAGRG
mmetsp:Transcript_25181/g.33420  ORF Transcript_25181/g.33420 Transcript_25181/m.33420 type:complete len:94 (+) Transcript_25181:658-939(+)